MPKADSIHNTLASGLNRRGLLVGGATALAASAALPALATQSPYSPEFREWYALAKTTPDIVATVEAWERAHPDADIDLRPDAQLYDAMSRLEDKIFARQVCSQTDIDELATIALYWTDDGDELELGHDIKLQSTSRDERSRAHLIQAAATLAMQRFGMGGDNV